MKREFLTEATDKNFQLQYLIYNTRHDTLNVSVNNFAADAALNLYVKRKRKQNCHRKIKFVSKSKTAGNIACTSVPIG